MISRPSSSVATASSVIAVGGTVLAVDLVTVTRDTGPPPLDVVGALLVVGLAVGGVVGTVGWVVGQAAGGLHRLLDLTPRASLWAPAFLYALPLSIYWVAVVEGVLAGQGFAARADAFAIRAAFHLAGLLVPWIVARAIFGHYFAAADRRPPPMASPVRHGVFVLVLGGALALAIVVERRVYPDRYHGFRLALCVSIVMLAALVGQALAACWPRRVAAHLPGATGLLAVASLVLVLRDVIPGDDPVRRATVHRHARIAGRFLALRGVSIRDEIGRMDAAEARRLLAPPPPPPRALLDRHLPGRSRWNLVLVTLDTVRADHVGCYGYTRHPTTPQLDRFAASGAVFENAWAQYPSSQLSMASFFRGLYPTACDVMAHRHTPRRLAAPLPQATLARLCRESGRRTVAITAFSPALLTRGFAYLRQGFQAFPTGEGSDVPPGDEVVDEAKEALGSLVDPFLLWVHLFDPHDPWRRHPDHAFGGSTSALYDGEIAFADAQLGRLLATLRARPDWDRTVVIVHSDHGEALGDHGAEHHGTSLHEEQIRVPLVMRVPGLAPGRIAQPVELVDLLPTCLDLLDLPGRPPTHGQSLVPLLLGDAAPEECRPPPIAFAQIREGTHTAPRQDAVRRGRYKLIRDVRLDVDELYDLADDPGETRNLAGSRPHVRRELRQLLSAFHAVRAAGPGRAWRGDADILEAARSSGSLEARRAALAEVVRRDLGFRARPVFEAAVAEPGFPLDLRVEALRLLVALGDPASTAPLRRLATRADVPMEIRVRALLGLVRTGGEGVLPDLISLDGDPDLGPVALWARALLGDVRVRDRLAARGEPEGELRLVHHLARARLGLGNGPEILDGLLESGVPDGDLELLALDVAAALARPTLVFSAASRILTREVSPAQHRALLRHATSYPPPVARPVIRLHLARQDAEVREVLTDWFRTHPTPSRDALGALREQLLPLRMRRGRDLDPGDAAQALRELPALTRTGADWGVLLEAWHALLAADRTGDAARLRAWFGVRPASLPASARDLCRRLEQVAARLDPARVRCRLSLAAHDPVLPGGSWFFARIVLTVPPDASSLVGGMGPESVRVVMTVAPPDATEPTAAVSLPLRVFGALPGESLEMLVPLKLPPLPGGTLEVRVVLARPGERGPLSPPISVVLPSR